MDVPLRDVVADVFPDRGGIVADDETYASPMKRQACARKDKVCRGVRMVWQVR